MSKKRIRTFSLVVDASVAFGAGAIGSQDPRIIRCREFLSVMRSVCHRMAWTNAIKAEWAKHESVFASQWRLTMTNLKKLRHLTDAPSETLRTAVEQSSNDKNVVTLLLKDAHLVEAALETDCRVVSLDEAARRHFASLAATFDPLRKIVWVNPENEDERPIEWLEDGAPNERRRRLKR